MPDPSAMEVVTGQGGWVSALIDAADAKRRCLDATRIPATCGGELDSARHPTQDQETVKGAQSHHTGVSG